MTKWEYRFLRVEWNDNIGGYGTVKDEPLSERLMELEDKEGWTVLDWKPDSSVLKTRIGTHEVYPAVVIQLARERT